jgi:predicted Zn finger-like uncharacterized protein
MPFVDQDGYRIKCPSCGAIYWYAMEKIDENGSVRCQNCNMPISTESASLGDAVPIVGVSDGIMPYERPFETTSTSEGIRVKCPHCGAKYLYKESQKQPDGRVQCQNCGYIIDAVGEDVIIYHAPVKSNNSETLALVCIVLLILLFVPIIIALPLLVLIVAVKFCSSSQSKNQETKVYTETIEGPEPR